MQGNAPKTSWDKAFHWAGRAGLLLAGYYLLLHWIPDYYDDGFVGRTLEDQFSFFAFIAFGSGLITSGMAWLITKDK